MLNSRINPNYLGKQLIQKKVCMTKDIGIHGNLFGGNILAWIDESAAGFISEAIGHRSVVTLKVNEVLFKEPVKVGDIINIDGEITKIGNSSITILITVLNTKTIQEVLRTELVFVHIDEYNNPKKI